MSKDITVRKLAHSMATGAYTFILWGIIFRRDLLRGQFYVLQVAIPSVFADILAG